VVDEEYAKTHPSTTFYAPVAGVHVSSTSAGSDAATKLQENDIITEVNGNTVSTIYHVMNIINEYNGGDSVTVKFYRGGKYYTVDITLGAAE
jgi:S1-C subfamily serine protease